eukprot:snap_masked-scaffold_30-processed-gene-3.78-mRNA-1 protein AED:1.00 eAED:1.00 QI:0/-1/0/0/-1/1/1/0/163
MDLFGFGILDKYNLFQGAFVIVDSKTGFTMYLPMKNKSSKEIVDKLLNNWTIIFGYPSFIRTDQEKCFMSQDFKDFLEVNKVQHSVSGIYDHSQNGVAERSLKYLVEQLKVVNLVKRQEKFNWPKLLALITTRRNATYSKACENTPYFVVFKKEWKYEYGLRK